MVTMVNVILAIYNHPYPIPFNLDHLVLYHHQSLAEVTLSRYSSPILVDNPDNLPFRVGVDVKSYPYNPDDEFYLSNYLIELRGCFKI